MSFDDLIIVFLLKNKICINSKINILVNQTFIYKISLYSPTQNKYQKMKQ